VDRLRLLEFSPVRYVQSQLLLQIGGHNGCQSVSICQIGILGLERCQCS
jgi:hypothetical protein